MASKKTAQNSAPHDLKTYKLYNKFAIGIHNFGIYS